MLLLPTPVRQTAHGNSSELCRRSRPVSQIMIFVFPAFTLSFLLHCFFPSQEPPDTFLERFCDDNKVLGIEVLPGDPIAELSWQGFNHNDEEQWAEYWSLVNTNLHFKLFTVALANMDTAPRIGIHPLHQSHNPLLHINFSQLPSDDLPRHSVKCLLQVYKSSCWQLDTSLAPAWQQRLRLLCLWLGRSQTWNRRLTPSVWRGHPQSSPGLSWPALSAWDRGSCPFPIIPLTLVEKLCS